MIILGCPGPGKSVESFFILNRRFNDTTFESPPTIVFVPPKGDALSCAFQWTLKANIWYVYDEVSKFYDYHFIHSPT